MNLPCTVCEAPVPVWQYAAHLKACVKIKAASELPVVLPAYLAHLDRLSAFQRNAVASPEHAYPPEVPTHIPPPPDPGSTPADKVQSWYQYWGQRSAVPDGRVQCAACNGLSHMYNCGACDGRGWV